MYHGVIIVQETALAPTESRYGTSQQVQQILGQVSQDGRVLTLRGKGDVKRERTPER
jgi:hypothetical protein